ncbi:MAG: IS110 family transposase [Syntrophothermus sp.]|uniref:IS110 family transposase n=1 Tax=Syntrophothermus sp. TaxID=2736299 RepID=UPI00257C5BC1|nr:IS110 family transposase [Syntrophothermus sp.]NSW83583.1 IS110 family transposase [Syntrophothermus sp.]
MAKTLFVGVDIGSDTNVVRILDDAGEEVCGFSVSNDLPGTENLVEKVVAKAVSLNATKIKIGMEATNLYWWHLSQALHEAPELSAFEAEVAVINPKVIDGFKRIYPDIAKTDALDARVIADCLRFGRVRPTPPPDMTYAPLQRLTRFRYHLVSNLTREKNRALNLIFLKFSTYQKECPFSDIFGQASRAVVGNLTPDEIAIMPVEELVDLMLQHGNKRLKDVPEMARVIKQAARNSYRLNPKMREAVDITLAMSLETIRFFESQQKKIDQVIAHELKAIPQTLDTVPGIGPVYAAGIVAEIGDISRFKNHNALAKFAGLTWRQHQSGKFTAEDIPLSRSGNYYLRYYLIEAANSVRVREPEYAEFYRKKFTEARHHNHKRALVLTARKLVRMVFTLLSEGQIYRQRRLG